MDSSISGLGYVGLQVSNVDAWHDLLTTVFALEHRPAPELSQYRMDTWKQRLSLYPSAADGVAHLGWEVSDRAAVDALKHTLSAADVAATDLTREECEERGVLGGTWFRDPFMQVRHELFWGPTILSEQFAPARPMQGYVTGDHGMGHVVLMTPRQEDAVAFFTEVLGFRVSDIMDFGGERWGGHYRHVFLHCNARHHSMAIMSPPAGGEGEVLNHLALTVQSFDDLGYAYDIVREKQIPVLMTLGRHVNDLATSFYVGNPSQSAIEMAWGGVEIGDDWSVKHYDDTKIWGHHLYLPPRPLG
ncbi:MAG: VOC family protein [Pseudomonadota bacterium]